MIIIPEEEQRSQETELEVAVYHACLSIFQRLEVDCKIIGNGHNAAQKAAQAAVKELRSRWNT